MPWPLPDPDWAYLRDRSKDGSLVLFLGAGFSIDTENQLGQSPPLGRALAEALAELASMEYSSEPLPTVYEVVRSRVGERRLLDFLEKRYSIQSFKDWYRLLPTFVWHRIFTTNIDNSLDQIYHSNSSQRLKRVVCPAPPQERDQLCEVLQAIHLHGHVDDKHSPLTFSFDDFAKQTARANPWYQILIDDLFSNPIVFVGTELADSPFHHYLEERGRRLHGERETRPKSFLVSPEITEIRQQQLSSSNIVPVNCTAETFFTELRGRVEAAATSVESVRQVIRPDLKIEPKSKVNPTPSIGRHFSLIRPGHLPPSPKHLDPNQFFLGAEPDWSDIQSSRDAHRQIVASLIELVSSEAPPLCTFFQGPAGSGKTTAAMRAATELGRKGVPAWYAGAAERLDLDPLLDHIHAETDDRRHIIFIDVAMRHLESIGASFARIKSSPKIAMVLIDRTNAFVRKKHNLIELKPETINIGDLTDLDISRLLDRLEHFNMLGNLKGKTASQRTEAFHRRAEKQLLVAMREATSGRGFDQILRNEFSQLTRQAKIAYVISSLAVNQGAPGVYRRHLLASIDRSDVAKPKVIDDLLKGVLVGANSSGTLLKPRHREIARWICTNSADDAAKFDAIVRFLLAVSGDIVPNEIKRRSPAFLGYRGLINSRGLWALFNDRSKVLDVYAAVKDCYSEDFLFWLHYGMVHMEAGHYDVAENYLNQSLGIRQENFQTIHQLGILHLRIACNSEPELASDRANEGIRILHDQIRDRGLEDMYPYGAYLKHVLHWLCHAAAIVPAEAWEDLKSVSQRARSLYGNDEYIAHWSKEVDRLYMMRAVALQHGQALVPSDLPFYEE